MCVIAIYETNYPKLEDLQSMQDLNADGAGFAWIEGKKVHYKKGLNLKAKDIFDYITTNNIQLPIIIHFRIKSSGVLCDELCHPFPISKKSSDKLENICDKVLFHNGTVYKYEDYLLQTCMNQGIKVPDGELSDSKVLAFLCSIYGDNFLRLVGNSSRFVIFSSKGIQKFGEWKNIQNCHLSNDYHIKETKINWFDNKKLFNNDKKAIKKIYDFDDIINDNIEHLSKDERKNLHETTCQQIDKIDMRLVILKNNLENYKNETSTNKTKKSIKSTKKRIESLEFEKDNKLALIDDLMDLDKDIVNNYSDWSMLNEVNTYYG